MLIVIVTVAVVLLMMIPILVVALLNVIIHGDNVHKLQQPVPVVLVHIATVQSLLLVAPVDKVDLLVGQAVRTPPEQ
jgi:hypothetical protein